MTSWNDLPFEIKSMILDEVFNNILETLKEHAVCHRLRNIKWSYMSPQFHAQARARPQVSEGLMTISQKLVPPYPWQCTVPLAITELANLIEVAPEMRQRVIWRIYQEPNIPGRAFTKSTLERARQIFMCGNVEFTTFDCLMWWMVLFHLQQGLGASEISLKPPGSRRRQPGDISRDFVACCGRGVV